MSHRKTERTKGVHLSGSQSPRVGVYVCHCGGNISDVVDLEEVVQAAARLPNVAVARRHMFMCSDPGQELIAEDIRTERLNRVVVAACSPSLHELTFRRTLARAGLNRYLFEHANLREQVSWCSKSDPQGATDKAIRLVGAAVAKARLLRPLEPIRVEAERRVAVIGGGVSGLRAARDLARSGLAVTLLERSPFLGGRMTQLGPLYPTGDDARDLLHDLIDEVTQSANVTVYTQADVTAASGYVGNFRLQVRLHPRGVSDEVTSEQLQAAIDACPETVESEYEHGLARRKAIYRPYPGCHPSTAAIDWRNCTRCGKCAEAIGGSGITLDGKCGEIGCNAGAIVVATGFDLYEPRQGEFGYGDYSEVITLPQLIRLLDPAGPTGGQLEWNGRPVRNLCLIHCVGSRQLPGIHKPGPDGRLNEYCSRVCCTATLQAAIEIRERFPEVNVFEFYQDIRTYGRGHEEYYEKACELGVQFLRYFYEDIRVYGPADEDQYNKPPKEKTLFFRRLAEGLPIVGRAEEPAVFPLVVRVKDLLTFGEELEVPADLVVLSVAMVPRDISGLVDMLKLPRSADGFLQEVHPKLRPVESAVEGVLIAGTCQAPMDITESCAAASAAAAKAVALLCKGEIELDPFVARVAPERCRGHGKCVEQCKYRSAITLVEKQWGGKPVTCADVNPALCNGCGMCAAVCPEGAIQVAGWRLDQFEAMVDALVADYAGPEVAHA
jgi:heterodisulfide reductase subunit A